MSSSLKKDIEALRREVMRRDSVQSIIDAIDVTQHIAPVYYGLHEDIAAGAHQYYNLTGGRGSGKSSI